MAGTTATLSSSDGFLRELLTSLNEGRPTSATNKIKMVENKAAIKQGESPTHRNIDENIAPTSYQTSQQPVRQNTPTVDMGNDTVLQERDDQFNADISRKNKTLLESINDFNNNKVLPTSTPTHQINQTQNGLLSEGALVESVKGVVNNYLSETLAPILEDTIKSTILELYAVERIKEVMAENSDLIKKMVYETIREIQAKTKK